LKALICIIPTMALMYHTILFVGKHIPKFLDIIYT
jgi:hypothetical protein